MRLRDLVRGPRGSMGEGGELGGPRGSSGHLGDPLGPLGWFYESSCDS